MKGNSIEEDLVHPLTDTDIIIVKSIEGAITQGHDPHQEVAGKAEDLEHQIEIDTEREDRDRGARKDDTGRTIQENIIIVTTGLEKKEDTEADLDRIRQRAGVGPLDEMKP